MTKIVLLSNSIERKCLNYVHQFVSHHLRTTFTLVVVTLRVLRRAPWTSWKGKESLKMSPLRGRLSWKAQR
uniref:Macaca fascicularis brain cDNA clone: QflA-16562, similar to human splicing factor, arginine/serine-rich 14 (SFRS14), mRNA, RefSeq: NM_014884.1 n=1 Tax=Macaca fascicularis TaxID=9541 RepID=I7GBF2_MACFA|nr:unnamed protein product [Macaca fascicularis]